MLRKLQRAHHTLRGHFAFPYLGVSIKLRAYLFFIYGWKGISSLEDSSEQVIMNF